MPMPQENQTCFAGTVEYLTRKLKATIELLPTDVNLNRPERQFSINDRQAAAFLARCRYLCQEAFTAYVRSPEFESAPDKFDAQMGRLWAAVEEGIRLTDLRVHWDTPLRPGKLMSIDVMFQTPRHEQAFLLQLCYHVPSFVGQS